MSEGYLHITGRVKDLIIRGGVKFRRYQSRMRLLVIRMSQASQSSGSRRTYGRVTVRGDRAPRPPRRTRRAPAIRP